MVWGDFGNANWAFSLSKIQGIPIVAEIHIPPLNPYYFSSTVIDAIYFLSDRCSVCFSVSFVARQNQMTRV